MIYVCKKIEFTDSSTLHSAKQEGQIMARVTHRHICKYKEMIVEQSHLHIIMEYADKGDLAGFLGRMDFGGSRNQLTQLGEARIWRFVIQICSALEVIHEKGVVHADLKPQNVLLSGSNYDPKLTDFGISQKLHKGYGFVHDLGGTLPYCSPEVLRGEKYNAKTDIWALGCLIYELSSRRRCFS